MPEEFVDAVFTAPPTAVVAALTGAVPGQGWQLTGIGGFGRVVTWQAFDRQLELVTLRADVGPDPERPELTRLRIHLVDPALAAALDTALAEPRVPFQRSSQDPRERPSAAG